MDDKKIVRLRASVERRDDELCRVADQFQEVAKSGDCTGVASIAVFRDGTVKFCVVGESAERLGVTVELLDRLKARLIDKMIR